MSNEALTRFDQKYKRTLTVMLRDDGPSIHMQCAPVFRTVRIELTPEQCAKMAPRFIGTNCGRELYEEIATAIIERIV